MELIAGNEFLYGRLINKKSLGTLVLFSASWCPYSEDLVQRIKSVYKEEGGVEVLFVSLDRNMQEFLKSCEAMPWLVVPYCKQQRIKRIVERYQVNCVPAVILVDCKGRVVAKDCKASIGRYGSRALKVFIKQLKSFECFNSNEFTTL